MIQNCIATQGIGIRELQMAEVHSIKQTIKDGLLDGTHGLLARPVRSAVGGAALWLVISPIGGFFNAARDAVKEFGETARQARTVGDTVRQNIIDQFQGGLDSTNPAEVGAQAREIFNKFMTGWDNPKKGRELAEKSRIELEAFKAKVASCVSDAHLKFSQDEIKREKAYRECLNNG